MCESIGHRLLQGRCPKGDRLTKRGVESRNMQLKKFSIMSFKYYIFTVCPHYLMSRRDMQPASSVLKYKNFL